MEWPRHCRFTVALLVLPAFWDASAAAAAMAPAPVRVDVPANLRVSHSRGDATTASHAGTLKKPLRCIPHVRTPPVAVQSWDLDELQNNGDFVGYQSGGFVYSVLRKEGFRENRLRPYNNKEEYAEALRKGSKNGGVSAVVDEIPYLTSFLTDPQYRKDFQMVNRIYKTPGLGFVFPLGSPLVHNLSTAILNVTGGREGSLIEAKWFGTGAPSTSFGNPNTDSTALSLRSFSGLFIITGCISALTLLISIIRSIHAKYTEVRDSDMQSTDGNSGSVRLGESSARQNDMVDGSVLDQPHHHEARNDGKAKNDGSVSDMA